MFVNRFQEWHSSYKEGRPVCVGPGSVSTGGTADLCKREWSSIKCQGVSP